MKLSRFLLPLVLCCTAFSVSAAKSNVTVTTLEYPPYVTATIDGHGWAWQVAEKALAAGDLSGELKILPWARAVKATEAGDMDALFIANKTPEREQWAIFSDKVGEEPTVVWKLKGTDIAFSEVGNLSSYKVGAIRDSSQQQYLEKNGITVTPVTSYENGLKMLRAKRIDAMVGDKFVVQHFANNNSYDDVDHVATPLIVSGFHLAVSKKVSNAQEIVDSFNKGINEIRENGTYDSILQKYGFQ